MLKNVHNHSNSSLTDDDDSLMDAGSNLNTSTESLINDESIPVFRQPPIVPKSTSEYESLDYEICDNELYQIDHKFRESHSATRKDFARWILVVLIGVLTALVACFVDIVIEELSKLKYGFLTNSVNHNVFSGNLFVPYLYYALANAVPVAFGAFLIAYVEPVASGSGVPLVKCYLNGVKVPRVVRIKTLVVKVVGVITSVVGGLAGGKEGPMIQAGSVIAAGISQGKSTTFNKDFGILKYFRDDHEKRDFVVGGAAAGVAAAFGAPLGGVLFSLEEACSFFNPSLILRTLVASIISSFTLNLVLSLYHGLKTFAYPGLFNLGKFEELPYQYYEIPIFVLMGCFGGILGALWIYINTKISIFRNRYFKRNWIRVLEAVFIAILTASIACFMIFTINDCRPLGNDPTLYPVQLFCKDNEYNVVAALWFQTPEASVKALFHDGPGSHQVSTLFIFVLVYFPLSCITYGLSASLGIFIPTLLVGAAWGRLTSMCLSIVFPYWTFIHPSKYALIGAAAQLGGVMRMTVSLTAILIETTGNISFALPLIITLISAKFCGDLFNEGIYDTQIAVSKVPMLGWRVKRPYRCLKALQIMSHPPVCIRLRESVSRIIEVLKTCPHNGFPVVDRIGEDGLPGHFCGLILRSQLVIIVKHRYYVELEKQWLPDVSIETFRNEYPRYVSIETVVRPEKRDYTVNMKMFMNRSAHSVWESASVPKIFEVFRALGLRHLVVVDKSNKIRGVITRKDFI